jgi:hypothetical protein
LKPAIGLHTAIKDSIFDAESTIGSITTSHDIVGSQWSAGASIGAINVKNSDVTVAPSVTTSRFLSGVNLGGDGVVDGDETYSRAGKIGNITIEGSVTKTIFSAGVRPGADGIFGNADDVAAAGSLSPAPVKAIGAMVFGPGSGPAASGPSLTHDFAIQAGNLKSLKISGVVIPLTGLPKYLDTGTPGEDADDMLVRII